MKTKFSKIISFLVLFTMILSLVPSFALGIDENDTNSKNTNNIIGNQLYDPIDESMFSQDDVNIKQILDNPNTYSEGVTVIGQIVYKFGNYDNTNSTILQDVINGKCYSLQVYNSLDDYTLGDIVKVNGKVSVYGDVIQLGSVKKHELVMYKNSIKAEAYNSIDELLKNKEDEISRFIVLKGVKLGKYNDNGNTLITDKIGKKINAYRASSYPIGINEGEIVDVYAVLSKYKSHYQLRIGNKLSNGINVYDVVNDTKAPNIKLPEKFLNAKINNEYTVSIEVSDNKGIDNVKILYKLGSTTNEVEEQMVKNPVTNKYEFTFDSSVLIEEVDNLTIRFSATDVSGLSTFTDSTDIVVENKPQVVSVSPKQGSSTYDNKCPNIQITMLNQGESPQVVLTLKHDTDGVVVDKIDMTINKNLAEYLHNKNYKDGKYVAEVCINKEDGKKLNYSWSFNIGEPKYNTFFGQLHSHTAEYSDGSGTLLDGLNYFNNLDNNENVDFVAFTDHSNYFDTKSEPCIEDALSDITKGTSQAQNMWNSYTTSIREFNKNNSGKVAIPGFEMTWSGGPGHINTFNTNGVVSRNNKTLNNKNGDTGLLAYYELLKSNPDSISQFNHPGKTFGTFVDFAYWDPIIDNRITMVEVGNGEGAIGSSGYFPSYNEYIKALDKGWHVAPTNNQDNHKGHWGNSNNARSVIITDSLTEDSLLDGMKKMSMYATEDKNLKIMYTVNDEIMGSIISDIPDKLSFNIDISDIDNTDIIKKVELVSNGGRIVWSDKPNATQYSKVVELSPDYSYYFLRVTQADKDIAVTAPVWVGEVAKVGISSMETDTIMPVKDEEMKFVTKMYNGEIKDLNIEKIEYTETYLGKTSIIKTVDNIDRIPSGTQSKSFDFVYNPEKLGFVTIGINVVAKLGDTVYNFNQNCEIEVIDEEDVIPIAIDAGHSNFYVSGNYAGSDTGLIEMCAKNNIRVTRLQKGELTFDKIKDMKLLVLTVPYVSFGKSVANYLYTQEELKAIKLYVDNGGNIILTSKSDRGNPSDTKEKASTISNKILEVIGAKARIGEGIVVDENRASNEAYRITLGGETSDDKLCYNYNSMNSNELAKMLLTDVELTTNNLFSAYNSAPIILNGATPIVSGFKTTTWSTPFTNLGPKSTKFNPIDENIKVTDKGNTHLIAAEKLSGGGFLITSGVTFFSTFEVKPTLDYASQLQNSNYQIVLNILNQIKPEKKITAIEKVHEANEGLKFTVEGIVMSNASGYDKNTAFFDCIYVQDKTAGINLFPVAGDIRKGQTVRVTGYTSSYLGERQLAVKDIEIIDSSIKELPKSKNISTKESNEGKYLGSLVQVTGEVISYTKPNGVVETIVVKDDSNVSTRIFIDGYITKDKIIDKLKVGSVITASGMESHDTLGYRIRIKNRDDVSVVKDYGDNSDDEIVIVNPDDENNNDNDDDNNEQNNSTIFKDISNDYWAKDAINFVSSQGLFKGMSSNMFMPNKNMSRAMVVTVLHRLEKEVKVEHNFNFVDIKKDKWFTEATYWANKKSIIEGKGNNRFDPIGSITREELVTMIYRYARNKSLDKCEKTFKLASFDDSKNISDWAVDSFKWAINNGLIIGNNNKINPNDTATRVEVALVLQRLVKLISK